MGNEGNVQLANTSHNCRCPFASLATTWGITRPGEKEAHDTTVPQKEIQSQNQTQNCAKTERIHIGTTPSLSRTTDKRSQTEKGIRQKECE